MTSRSGAKKTSSSNGESGSGVVLPGEILALRDMRESNHKLLEMIALRAPPGIFSSLEIPSWKSLRRASPVPVGGRVSVGGKPPGLLVGPPGAA